MREQTGGYTPGLRKAGEAHPSHYCPCRHLLVQHGWRGAIGCPWCPCEVTP